MLKGARYVGRGLKDTYDNLVHFTLMSLAWWICVLSVVLAPAATLALFAHADPRIGTSRDRPSAGETIRFVIGNVWRGWRLGLLTLPVVLLLSYNIAFYGARTSALGILAPLWLLLFLISVLITASAFAIQALLEERRALASIRLSAIMVGAHLGHALLMLVLIVGFAMVFAVLIVPFIFFTPAFIAAVLSRFTLSSLRVSIPDPLEPTPERAAEGKERRKWWGP